MAALALHEIRIPTADRVLCVRLSNNRFRISIEAEQSRRTQINSPGNRGEIMWRKIIGFLAPVCVVAPLLIFACSSAKDSTKFAANAAQGGMAEVELGRLATQKAADPSVREFGARMIADHSRANSELKSIAAQKGIQLPADLNSEQKSERDKLAQMSGAEFDKEYMSAMVKDHETDVKDFDTQAKDGNDADIKAFAGKTLPTLQEHLKMAQTAAQKVGAK
jgi:putative membrane protein